MENIQAKLEAFKIAEYGKVAVQLRRGLINFDEAQFFWDTAEHKYRELQEMLKVCETDTQQAVFVAGLDSLK
jgi:hypothetical protein